MMRPQREYLIDQKKSGANKVTVDSWKLVYKPAHQEKKKAFCFSSPWLPHVVLPQCARGYTRTLSADSIRAAHPIILGHLY